MLLKMNDTDLQLLARYAQHHAEDAFAEIVRRHIGLVYSAARRQVRSPQLAEEVTQSAFTDLARNARCLAPDTLLTAWLYQVTRRTAIDVIRREARRQLREQIATEMNALNADIGTGCEPVWKDIEPLLDEAMAALDATDRAAVLLRYFENKSLREVGQRLGVSDDAAQKRVSRAVERLREFFAKRGVTVGAGGLVVVISANAVQAAPVGLIAAITTASLAGTVTAATIATTTTMHLITMKFIAATVTAALTAGAGTYFVQQREASRLRSENQNLIVHQEAMTRERDDATRRLAALRDENERLNENTSDLLRLRGEVTRLRNEARQWAASSQGNQAAGVWSREGIAWLPKWKDAGLSSPEAAMETYCWSLANTNVDRLRGAMVWDRRTNAEPVSAIFAKREARQDGDKWRAATSGGVRIHRRFPGYGQNLDRAVFEVEIMNPRIEGGKVLPLDPANPPAWDPTDSETFDLVKADDEWKVIRDDRLRLAVDDDDSEAVARMMMKMDPKTLEQLKTDPRLPLRTLQAYEELKAQSPKLPSP